MLLSDLPTPSCPTCTSRDWRTSPEGWILCQSGHPLLGSKVGLPLCVLTQLMPHDVDDYGDFVWPKYPTRIGTLLEPSLRTLRHHLNATIVNLVATHAALVEAGSKYDGVVRQLGEVGERYAALEGRHGALEGRYAALEERCAWLEARGAGGIGNGPVAVGEGAEERKEGERGSHASGHTGAHNGTSDSSCAQCVVAVQGALFDVSVTARARAPEECEKEQP